MLNMMIGIIPGIIFAIIFYLLDRNKKDINLIFLLGAFVFGGISSYICYRLEWHFGGYFKEMYESNILEVFIYALLGVALFEEGAKLFFSFLFSSLNKVRKLSNIVTYCVVSACGFLAFENAIFYSMRYGLNTSISRIFTASPMHVCCAIIMGVLLYRVIRIKKFNIKSIMNMFITLLVPCVIHALYNTFLYQNNSSIMIFSYLLLVLLVIICFIIVIRVYFLRRDL